MTLLKSFYFCSVAVPLSNLRMQCGSAGGVGSPDGIRGRCYTVSGWDFPPCRSGTQVTGGEFLGVGSRLSRYSTTIMAPSYLMWQENWEEGQRALSRR